MPLGSSFDASVQMSEHVFGSLRYSSFRTISKLSFMLWLDTDFCDNLTRLQGQPLNSLPFSDLKTPGFILFFTILKIYDGPAPALFAVPEKNSNFFFFWL